jgi:hypothetical protein
MAFMFPETENDIVAEVQSVGNCPLYGEILRDLFPKDGDTGQSALLQFCDDNKLMVSMVLGTNGVGSDVFVFTKDFRGE